MATRRIIATEKTILDRDDAVEEKSNISPAVPKCDLSPSHLALDKRPLSLAKLTKNPAMSSSSSSPSLSL